MLLMMKEPKAAYDDHKHLSAIQCTMVQVMMDVNDVEKMTMRKMWMTEH